MPSSEQADAVIRFQGFELNPQTGELRKEGIRLRIQDQPLKVLVALLQHPGHMVTREELRQLIWPEETFGDFDHAINLAITKLRGTLGDSADVPHFIETLPRRGYRFIGPVDSHSQTGVVPVPGSRIKCLVIAGVASLAVLATAGYFYFHRAPKLTDRDTLVLADFDNKTGDAVFDDTLRQGLSVQLEQSPFLNLLSDRRVNETLKLMGRSPDERLTANITREVCERTGSKAMLTGSITSLGSQYVIGLKIMSCNTGEVLAEAQEQAANKENVLKVLDKGASNLRRKLGESQTSVQKYGKPLEEATTPSLEALKAFSEGVRAYTASGDSAALPFFKRAVELDPKFAMAHGWMAYMYVDLSESGRAVEFARKAYDLREKVSEQERFTIEIAYYMIVTGELERAAQSLEVWRRIYPRNTWNYNLMGSIADTLGNREKARDEYREAMRLEPDVWVFTANFGMANVALNRLDEAEAVYKQAEEHKMDSPYLLWDRYFLAFLKDDEARMAQMISIAIRKNEMESMFLATEADTEGWHGRLKNAGELTRKAMDSAVAEDAKETAASYQALAALREVESGYRGQARSDGHAALRLAPEGEVRILAALALARAGDAPAAEQLAIELDKTFPLDTVVQRYWLPTIRAAIALDRKDPVRAIELLKAASTTELGTPSANLVIALCPIYLRGEAYLMLHDSKAAAAEFQKFIDHRGLVVNFPWGVLARLQLARSYAMQGNTANARAAYQEFLTIWKDADPNVPVLKQAKVEYAKLQ